MAFFALRQFGIGSVQGIWILAIITAVACAEDPINFEQHVRPVFREYCWSCHDGEKQTGGLSLETYATVMAGGAGGEVIYGGELESSRLWTLVHHDEEPKMPPNRDRLPDETLELIRQWIEQGALERSDSPVPIQEPVALEPMDDGLAESTELGAMPEGLLREPPAPLTRPGAVIGLAASPNAPLLAVGRPRQIALYQLPDGEPLGDLEYPQGLPNVVRFSRDGSLLLVAGGRPGHSGSATVFDVRTGERRVTVGDERDCVLAADIDRSLQLVAIGGTNKLVRVFTTEKSALQYEIRGHIDWVTALQFSPDGKFIASGDRQGMLVIWEADKGGEYQVLQGHAGAVTAVSWRKDAKSFASASEDGSVKIWNVERANPVRSWTAHEGGCLDVQLRGELVATAGRDRTMRIWDPAGQQRFATSAAQDLVLHAEISHDDSVAISGDWLGNVRIWSTQDGTEIADMPKNRGKTATKRSPPP